jgi:hypothetical protein
MIECVPFLTFSNGVPYIFIPLIVLIVLNSLKEYQEDLKEKQANIV